MTERRDAVVSPFVGRYRTWAEAQTALLARES
jgi:hypothetical protein